MNLKQITYLVIIASYFNYTRGINSYTNTNRRPLMRCNSAPDLISLYNNTVYTASATSTAKTSKAATIASKNDIVPVPSSKYKSLIFNRYKRNIYLRSKEKYTLGEK
jgi:hypothetical protein